jgi:DNA-binding beta-propeller fold protein YncE
MRPRRLPGWAGAAGLAAVLMLAGCSQQAAPRHPLAHPPSVAAAAQAPGCSVAVSAGRPLAAAADVTEPVPGQPYAVAVLPGGRYAVASLWTGSLHGTGGALELLAIRPRALSPVRTISLPAGLGGASGMAVTRDGQLLLVAAETATAVVSVRGLEDGAPDPVEGILGDAGVGQIEVAVTPDDHYAFVSDENSGGLSVFNLALARKRGFGAPGVAVGIIRLAPGPVGIAISPNAALVYVTTLGGAGPHGELWVINASAAERGAGQSAVLGHVYAGCQPVRVVLSPAGSLAWVSALQSDAVLAFQTSRVLSDPAAALRAVVHVGAEPVGLVLLNRGQLLVVGDSDRYGIRGGSAISLVSADDALAGMPAVLGSLPAGQFPRDFAYDASAGAILVPNYVSETVELVRPGTWP